MQIEDFTGTTSDADLVAGASRYSPERAVRIVAEFARVTTSQDAAAFVQGFTEDCVVHYPPAPPLVGRDALQRLMAQFFSVDRQGFVCEKRLRSISGDVLGVIWINRWTDARSGKPKISKGVEFWTMSGDRIARWDASSTTWDLPS